MENRKERKQAKRKIREKREKSKDSRDLGLSRSIKIASIEMDEQVECLRSRYAKQNDTRCIVYLNKIVISLTRGI